MKINTGETVAQHNLRMASDASDIESASCYALVSIAASLLDLAELLRDRKPAPTEGRTPLRSVA
jgi:hypothetical protein